MKKSLLLLFILAACGTGGYVEPNYYVGTEGLVPQVYDNVGSEVYEGLNTGLNIRVWNRGATRVNQDFLHYGLKSDPFYATVSDGEFQFQNPGGFLYGKEIGYPEGDWLDINHIINVKEITGLRAQPSTQLFGSLCYPYETLLGSSVCVDSNSYNGNIQQQVCSATNMMFESQGAPIAITQVENIPTPIMANSGGGGQFPIIRPTFVVHIENVGNGAVVMPVESKDTALFSGTRVEGIPTTNDEAAAELISSYFYDKFVNKGQPRQETSTLKERVQAACSQSQTQYNNAVSVYALLSNNTLDCNPATVPLINGKGFTTCTLPYREGQPLHAPNYEGSFQVRLAYVYKSTFTHDLEIIRRDSRDDRDLTIEELNNDPAKVQGFDRCVFCSQNPSHSECQKDGNEGKLVTRYEDWPITKTPGDYADDTTLQTERDGKTLSRQFKCNCAREDCIPGDDKKDCIIGNHWCSGTNYCCADSWDVVAKKAE